MKEENSRSRAKHEEILAAAAEVFRAEGYEAASMDRVAERAGASKRTVYNHFGSKEALFEEVVTRLFDAQMASKQIAWDPRRTLEEQLRDFARAKGAVAEDDAAMALTRVVLGVAIRDPGIIERFLSRYQGEEDALLLWLERAHAAGALVVPDVALAAELFWSMAGGALFWPAAVMGCQDLAARERITDELVACFLARYQPRKQEVLI